MAMRSYLSRPDPISVLLAALLAIMISDSIAKAGTLQAGAGVCDITVTPPVMAIHDPLYVKALVVDDGHTQAAIICLDTIVITDSFVVDIRHRIEQQLGIKGTNILVNASHDHHTQGQVARDVVERTVKAVRQALDCMGPVTIGVGAGHEDRITMNRRLHLRDGTEWTIRRANPSPPDDDVTKLGPLDPEIGILRLDRTDGRPLAVLYNFAGHAYGGVPDGSVTADFPGFASSVIETALAHGVVALFLQGAAGDVTPIRYKDLDAPPPTARLGTMLGLSTLKAAQELTMQKEGTVRVASRRITLPRRDDIDAQIKRLESEQEKILQFFTGVGCGVHGAGTFLNFKTFLPLYLKHTIDPDHPAYASYLYLHEDQSKQKGLEELDAENRKRIDKYLASVQQMERLIRIRSNLHIFEQQRRQQQKKGFLVEVQGIRIGRFVIVTFPGELFTEVALHVKKQSPFEFTFVAGYSNGHVGYAPTRKAYDGKAYEDALTRLAPQWQEIYEEAAIELLRSLK